MRLFYLELLALQRFLQGQIRLAFSLLHAEVVPVEGGVQYGKHFANICCGHRHCDDEHLLLEEPRPQIGGKFDFFVAILPTQPRVTRGGRAAETSLVHPPGKLSRAFVVVANFEVNRVTVVVAACVTAIMASFTFNVNEERAWPLGLETLVTVTSL